MGSCYVARGAQLGASVPQMSGTGWGGSEEEAQEGWDICVYTANSHCCIADTNIM